MHLHLPNLLFRQISSFTGIFPAVQIQLTEITEIYPQLWEDDGFTVRVFPAK